MRWRSFDDSRWVRSLLHCIGASLLLHGHLPVYLFPAPLRVMSRLIIQPVARIEDLLLTLPPSLISPLPPASLPPTGSLPLPQPCLSITLTPGWCQLFIWSNIYGTRGAGRDMVFEVKRMETLEGTVTMIQYALEQLGRGTMPWGMAKYEAGVVGRYRTFEHSSTGRRGL